MKKQEFIKLNCAPSRNGLSEFTCYKSNEILKMKENWNNRHPDVKIVSQEIKEIWEELKNNMEETCNNEACWLRQKFMENENNNELLQYTFAPKAPKSWLKNPTEWLSSLDINKIMKQYEHDFPNFDFIGPSPIDFDTFLSTENKCVWEELCHFSLKKHLSKGKQKIGIIFNTDKHNEGGSHWISLFINIEKGKNYIFFFDSNGVTAPPEIKVLRDRILNEAKNDLGITDLTYYENKKSHQKGNTECGMYSLYLIIELLTEAELDDGVHTIDYFMNDWIPDKTVQRLREVYYNKDM